MGGIVLQNDTVSDRISDILLKDVLPVVRQKGWYGVGGLDVLLDSNDGIYFIDPNFRITAMSAYVYQAVDGVVGKNMLTMTARFGGSEKELKHLAESNGRSQLFNLIAARRDAQGFQFNGALLFDGKETLRENAKRAIDEGVQAPVLSAVVNNDSEITIPVLP